MADMKKGLKKLLKKDGGTFRHNPHIRCLDMLALPPLLSRTPYLKRTTHVPESTFVMPYRRGKDRPDRRAYKLPANDFLLYLLAPGTRIFVLSRFPLPRDIISSAQTLIATILYSFLFHLPI